MWNGNIRGAIQSLRVSKWRSILTMLGIVIGVSSVVTIVSLGEGLKHQILGQINQLGNNVLTVRSGTLVNRGQHNTISGVNLLAFLSSSTLTPQDVDALGKLPNVSSVVPMSFVTNTAKSDSSQLNNVFAIGTSPDAANILHQKLDYGMFFNKDDPDQNYAVIGPNIAEGLFGQLNPIGHSFTLLGKEFIVQGVMAPSSGGILSAAEIDYNSTIFIPFQAGEQLSSGHAQILQVLVKSSDKNIDSTAATVRQSLLGTHSGQEDFTVLKQDELLDIAGGVVNILTGFITAIASISLLVGGIGIMDIMLVSVSERTREIGIRKAVGATNRQILSQFMIEGIALSVTGGLIGVGIAMAVNGLLRLYTTFDPVVSWPVVGLAVGVSVSIGIIFSAAPALKAARKDPIDALRYE